MGCYGEGAHPLPGLRRLGCDCACRHRTAHRPEVQTTFFSHCRRDRGPPMTWQRTLECIARLRPSVMPEFNRLRKMADIHKRGRHSK